MAEDGPPILSDMDFGGWADFYASSSCYGHFKDELYPVFANALRTLPAGSRVLDIGAGPGNLTLVYGKLHPGHGLAWTLFDASRELLRIASERLSGLNLTCVNRSFNQDGWSDGLLAPGPFAAIVSTNALFIVSPERLNGIYADCFRLLAPGGWLMNLQSFGWNHLEDPHARKGFPAFAQKLLGNSFPGNPPVPPEETARRDAEKKVVLAKRDQAIAAAKAAGANLQFEGAGYQFLTAEEHQAALRSAGFLAGEVWRKREFAVILARKP